MKRLMIAIAALAVLGACGDPATQDRDVASLSTSSAGDATAASGDATDEATDTTAVTDPNEAALQFAKCMREHGVDMPDPVVDDGGGVMVQIGGVSGEGPDPKDVDAANKACQHFMEAATAGFDPPSEEDQKKMQDQALAFAKCMREHGIDMPDPQFGTDGNFSISVGGGPGANAVPVVDLDNDEFKAASDACGGPGGGFAISTKPTDG